MAVEDGLYGQSREVIPYEPPQKLRYEPTKFYQCPRCKQKRPAIGLCPTCPAFDAKTCVCGHVAKVHSFMTGPRSGKEIDVCGMCLALPTENQLHRGEICKLFLVKGASCNIDSASPKSIGEVSGN